MPNLKDNRFNITYLDEALDDIERYPSNKDRIFAIIRRVNINPLSYTEGGYGKPLGKVRDIDLTNCFKIKIKRPPIRIVYKLYPEKNEMLIITVGSRDELEAYKLALRRLLKHGL